MKAVAQKSDAMTNNAECILDRGGYGAWVPAHSPPLSDAGSSAPQLASFGPGGRGD
ncbi:hypothetical protein GCM10023161_08870 [Mycobacterium paraffinicum]|uniref:Uncharacterized protein n=1 Tax=Mycobacterium paraffinicum TaxID=53378 RepID=A0ABP8RCA0_9MYCO